MAKRRFTNAWGGGGWRPCAANTLTTLLTLARSAVVASGAMWLTWLVFRLVGSVALLFGLGISPVSCSDGPFVPFAFGRSRWSRGASSWRAVLGLRRKPHQKRRPVLGRGS